MKVSVPKDFGNTSKNHVLPLVPAPIKSIKKEDLTTVNLYSDPGDHNSTQVKFSFKGLDGDHETPREILEWRRNVDQALTGLNLNANGLSSYNMCKQFMRGSALSTFIAKAGAILVNKKAEAIVTAEKPRDNYPAATEAGYILADFTALRVAVTTANTRNTLDQLTEAYGPEVVCMYVNCPPVSKWWNIQSMLLLHGKAIHHWMHHKVVQEIGSLPVWQAGFKPAAQLLQFSHQGLLLNNQLLSFYCYLSLLLKPPRPMPPAQKEGEDEALPGLLPSSPPKYLQGLGPWPRTKQGGGGWKLKVVTDQEFHPPPARQQALPAFSSDPTSR